MWNWWSFDHCRRLRRIKLSYENWCPKNEQTEDLKDFKLYLLTEFPSILTKLMYFTLLPPLKKKYKVRFRGSRLSSSRYFVNSSVSPKMLWVLDENYWFLTITKPFSWSPKPVQPPKVRVKSEKMRTLRFCNSIIVTWWIRTI